MAVDFSLLQPADPAGAFFRGREAALAEQDRNALRQIQAQQQQRLQLEFEQSQEDRRRRAAQEGQFQKLAGLIRQHGMDPDDPKVLGEFAEAAMLSGQPQLSSVVSSMAERAAKRRQAAAEAKLIGGILGPQTAPAAPQNALAQPAPTVNALAAPQADLLAGTPFAIGPMAAPAPAARAPVPAAPSDNTAKIAELERQRDALEALGTPAALAQAKRLDRQLEKLQPKTPSAPSIVEYNFARTPEGGGFKGSYSDFLASKRPKTTVNVGVSTEKKYGEQFAGNVAKADEALWSAAQDAPFAAENANRILSTLASGKAITGPLADVKLNIARALNVAGADNAEMIFKTEALVTSMAENTLNAIKTSGLGTGQGFTDKDLKFLQEAKSGNINFQPDTIRQLAELAHRAAEKTAEKWSNRVKQIPKSALEGTGVSTEPITVPKRASSVTATARPSGVGPDWTLMQDANGRKAWVSPDGKQHKEVQ